MFFKTKSYLFLFSKRKSSIDIYGTRLKSNMRDICNFWIFFMCFQLEIRTAEGLSILLSKITRRKCTRSFFWHETFQHLSGYDVSHVEFPSIMCTNFSEIFLQSLRQLCLRGISITRSIMIVATSFNKIVSSHFIWWTLTFQIYVTSRKQLNSWIDPYWLFEDFPFILHELFHWNYSTLFSLRM